MNAMQKDVWHFCKAAGIPAPEGFQPFRNNARRERAAKIVEEEAKEMAAAIRSGDLTGILDGGGDLVYVIMNTFVELGLDFDPIWEEIHRSNMDKYPFETNEWGKVIKPKHWKPPCLARIGQIDGRVYPALEA